MANGADLKKQLHEEQALRLKLDALVCEAHQVLASAKEHYSHSREAEASILVDAAHRILATHAEG